MGLSRNFFKLVSGGSRAGAFDSREIRDGQSPQAGPFSVHVVGFPPSSLHL